MQIEVDGFPTTSFALDEYGGPQYPGLVVFSTEEEIASDPELMQGFVAATIAGYDEVIADEAYPQIGLDALLAENPAIPEDFAEASLEAYEPLFQADADSYGDVPDRRTSRSSRRSWSTTTSPRSRSRPIATRRTSSSRGRRSNAVTASARLRTEGLSKAFPAASGNGDRVRALEGVDMEVGAGEFVSIVGPSGCGKSTLFNLLAGLDRPSGGRILLDGRPADQLLGEIGYMPQSDLLMPWRTVLDNTALGLELGGVSRKRGP